MLKKLLVLVIFVSLFLLNADVVRAEGLFVSSSAKLEISALEDSGSIDYRAFKLRSFLEKRDSPLADYSEELIAQADKYQIDWRLVAAISGVESSFGKQMPKNSFNAWGWNGGNYRFDSWNNAIEVVTKTLRENYYNKGANSVDKISRIYCPPSTTWSGKVKYFMKNIDPTSLNFNLDPNL